MISFVFESPLCNPNYSYQENKFRQLFGQLTINEYNVAIHLLENNNMFTVREVDAMITKTNEDYFKKVILNVR